MLPLDLVLDMKSRCEERLEIVHGVAIEHKNENKFISIRERDSIKATTKWPHILIRISIYYILSALFFVSFYYQGYILFMNSVDIKPIVDKFAGDQSSLVVSSYF